MDRLTWTNCVRLIDGLLITVVNRWRWAEKAIQRFSVFSVSVPKRDYQLIDDGTVHQLLLHCRLITDDALLRLSSVVLYQELERCCMCVVVWHHAWQTCSGIVGGWSKYYGVDCQPGSRAVARWGTWPWPVRGSAAHRPTSDMAASKFTTRRGAQSITCRHRCSSSSCCCCCYHREHRVLTAAWTRPRRFHPTPSHRAGLGPPAALGPYRIVFN